MKIENVIGLLRGMGDANDMPRGLDKECVEAAKSLQELLTAAREVVSDSETSWDDEGMNLVGTDEIDALCKAVYH